MHQLRSLIGVTILSLSVLTFVTAARAQAPDAGPDEPLPPVDDTAGGQAQPELGTMPGEEQPAPPAPEPVATTTTAAPATQPAAGEDEPTVEERLEALEHLKISGYIQAQLFLLQESGDGVTATGAPENADLFEVRRGRLKVTYAWELAEFMLQIDATNRGVALRDAEATLVIPWTETIQTRLTGGLFKAPFGYDILLSSSERAFPERSLLAQRFFPGERDVGVRLKGGFLDDMLTYQLALQNGNPIGDALFPGLDPNGWKDFVGRLGFAMEPVSVGVSGVVGEGYLPPAADDPLTMMVDESHPSADFFRWAAGLDARVVFELPVIGKLDVYGEIALAQNLDRKAATGYPTLLPPALTEVQDTQQLAWYLAAVQQLGEYFALGVRLEQFDPNTDTGDDILTYVTFAGLFMPTKPVRVTVAYEVRGEQGVANDRDDNAFWLRLQVKF